MESGIGLFLRELRSSRQISLGRLAEKAAVGKSTLSQWETGVYQPDLPTLEAVLKALSVSAAQRERALTLIQAPRAVRQAQDALGAQAAALGIDDLPIPTPGELLRAMRHRRRLSLEQVAAQLGVRPSTVSRWEQMKATPPPDRREALFDLLRAHPEERAVLVDQRLLRAAALDGSDASLEALEYQCNLLEEQVNRGQKALMDLRFLTAEAKVWPRAARSQAARRLLARFYALHGMWLSIWGRMAEAGRYAERALELVVHEFQPERFWLEAVQRSAMAAVHAGPRMRPQRGVERVQLWLDFMPDPLWESALYRDLAGYLGECREFDGALQCIGRAHAAAARSGEWLQIRSAKHIQVYILLEAGRPQEALPWLPADDHPDPQQRRFEAYTWVRTMLGLGEKAAAHEWLNRTYAILRELEIDESDVDWLAASF
jgi:transcriptional regulator with XRE-family HTH domain